MKLFIVISCALVAVAVAAPVEPEPVQILHSTFEKDLDNPYNVGNQEFETSDGNKREEKGKLQEVPNEEGKLVKALTVSGSYSYIDTDGNTQDITYIADQNGFHAEGPSIPKNPEGSR